MQLIARSTYELFVAFAESHDVRRASLETGKLSNEVIWSFFRNFVAAIISWFFSVAFISNMHAFLQNLSLFFWRSAVGLFGNRRKRRNAKIVIFRNLTIACDRVLWRYGLAVRD